MSVTAAFVLFSCLQGQQTYYDPLQSDFKSLAGYDSFALSRPGIKHDQGTEHNVRVPPSLLPFPLNFKFYPPSVMSFFSLGADRF